MRAQGKMMRKKAGGPADCLVTEMLQCLLVHEVTHWFEKRFKGECRAPEAWKILRQVFLQKPDASLEKGLRGFRAVALRSVFSTSYTTVLVELVHEEKEPIECFTCEAERGVDCEHMQDLLRIYCRGIGNGRRSVG